ncbi:MAG TPA: M23 family metallopeptidase [Leucothrix sp.]|nr:M23 family metallopeptidase [Leucothrix sp.]HIQ14952.1 M23 family metallopeptidase [Leucothrix sp.]
MKKVIIILSLIFGLGFLVPEDYQMPVLGATQKDWNPKSFWYYPWGRNRVHKGIDIFAKASTPIVAPTGGFILFSGENSLGGNVILMLGAKWRLHYFAHLKEIKTKRFKLVTAGQTIGIVGSTGNAKGKQPHLHYSIKSLFPRFWQYDISQRKSLERIFFIDPGRYLMKTSLMAKM